MKRILETALRMATFLMTLGIWVAVYVTFRSFFAKVTGLEAQFAIVPWFLVLFFLPKVSSFIYKTIDKV